MAPWHPLRLGILVQCHVQVGHGHQPTSVVLVALNLRRPPHSVLGVLQPLPAKYTEATHLSIGSLCLGILGMLTAGGTYDVESSLLAE